MTFNADDMPTEEELREKLVAQVEHGYEKINDSIDEMSSSQLKRILKAVTFIDKAGHLLYNDLVDLSDEESELIDDIYNFQNPMLMLMNELNAETTEEGEENEQVD